MEMKYYFCRQQKNARTILYTDEFCLTEKLSEINFLLIFYLQKFQNEALEKI